MIDKLPFRRIKPLGVAVQVRLLKRLKGWGEYDEEKNIIRLARGPAERVSKTLIHEIVHHWESHLVIDQDDDTTSRFELAVYDLIVNCPEVIEFVQSCARRNNPKGGRG